MTVVVVLIVIVIVAVALAIVREVFATEPAEATSPCRTCGAPAEPLSDYCRPCFNARLRSDVQLYVQGRKSDPQLYNEIVDRLVEDQQKSEKAGRFGSNPALAPTPKDLTTRSSR